MSELDKIVEQLSKLTIIEASELASKLEEKWGVSASPVASISNSSNTEDTAPDEVKKTEFSVVLKSSGSKKIEVIKSIKSILGIGLKEAKTLVDSAPTVIKENVPKDEAEEIQSKLIGSGAEVELK
jgi:large subunit ribosomal protein L7/L12